MNISHTEPKRYLIYDEEFYYPASIAQRGLNTTTHEEYEPRWVNQRLQYSGNGPTFSGDREKVQGNRTQCAK